METEWWLSQNDEFRSISSFYTNVGLQKSFRGVVGQGSREGLFNKKMEVPKVISFFELAIK